MVNNRIRSLREKAGLTQNQLVKKMDIPGDTTTTLSLLETGKVLPTKPYLESLCKALDKVPSELYSLDDLKLVELEKGDTYDARMSSSTSHDKSHDGLIEFRVWLKPDQKQKIEKAISYLGYTSLTEWFRESYRDLIYRAARIIATGAFDEGKD